MAKVRRKLKKIILFSRKTFLEVLASIFTNLTSGWFGVLFIAPGVFGVKSVEEYLAVLTQNLPFAILGLVFSLFFAEKAKSL